LRIASYAFLMIVLLAVLFGCPKAEEEPADDGMNVGSTTATTPPAGADSAAEGEIPAAPEGVVSAAGMQKQKDAEAAGKGEGSEAVPPAGDGTEGTTSEGGAGNMVVLETTKGNIVIQLHPEWSPKGVEHFKELVNAKFYDGAPWFRVIEGFVAQCGVAADPALNEKWGDLTIPDEPVVQGNKRGTVVYGKTGAPNSRSTHIFINFVDNSANLDRQGFSAFGEVVEGMDVADKLTRCEYVDQMGLAAAGGMDKFKQQFPDADYILKAYFK